MSTKRTNNNGELRESNVGQRVNLIGWVAKRRNLGSLVFIDLRDRYGITQITFDEHMAKLVKDVRNEYIIAVTGIVKKKEVPNQNLPTGGIEVIVENVEIINSSLTPPIIIADETDALEDTRLKYRYLDLRRPVMQQKLIIRHKVGKAIRNYLDNLDFIEVETPILTKSTPEGARDYLVPSRVHAGEFYALPQSPQLFKQLLMVAGFEKYYQFARCFRDEDLRADRQLDFSQVDIETSFTTVEDIFQLMESMMVKISQEVFHRDLPTPFTRISYYDAMNNYGSDKPDNRFNMQLISLDTIFCNSEFKVFSSALADNKVIKAVVLKKVADNYSRKAIDQLTDLVKKHGASGLVTLKYQTEEFSGSAAKFISVSETQALVSELSLENDDMLFIVCDKWELCCTALGALRLELAQQNKLIPNDVFSYLWVVDFPLFEYDDQTARYYAKHHPFTRFKGSIEEVKAQPDKALAEAYDLVLNGSEIGGGSLRIYDQNMQKAMFELLGFSESEIKERFGFFMDALQYGTPPHGGIALGYDRFIMMLTQANSIRDVIAFPKTQNAKCPLTSAPSSVDQEQLDELHLLINQNNK
ncbi:MAG: aspartate--tRNA ligase [Erysipelotrichaceae bacterium]